MLSFHLKSVRLCFLVGYVSCSMSACVVMLPFIDTDRIELEQSEATTQPVDITTKVSHSNNVRSRARRDSIRIVKLMRELHHEEPAVRTRAASSLGALGSRARKAVPLLIARLNDSSKHVRRASAKSLGKMHAPEAVSPLIRRLDDKDWFVAHSAANALKKIGTPKAKSALEHYRHSRT